MDRPFVTAVTHSADEARITLTGLLDRPGVAGRILSALAEARVVVDTIVLNSPEKVVSDPGGALAPDMATTDRG